MSENFSFTFVTRIAVLRQRCELGFLIVTSEATRVIQWFQFALRLICLMTIGAIRIGVFVVREEDANYFTRTRKRPARGVAWRRFHVAVGADLWDRPLTREELLPVTVEARCVFGKISYVRKCCVAFSHHLVTCAAREFFFRDVSGVREV